jgi:D-alanine-D-alanine ligase-like ATP-grasp enzyme
MKNYLKESGNIHLSYYLEAADILDIKYEVLVHKLLARFEYGERHWFIINTVTPLVNSPGKTIAARKNLTNIILRESGVPTPKQEPLLSVENAVQFFKKNESIVLKPKQNLGGRGISTLPGSIKEVEIAFENARQNDKSGKEPRVLGETFVKGENFRLLTLAENVIGAVKRLPAQVKGDGKNNIQELIKTKNPKVPIDSETVRILKKQGFTLTDIPKDNEVVCLRSNTNLTTGGTTQECLRDVHPYYKNLAVKALKALDIKLGGVDLITEDITKPGECAINEINYNPGLRIHYQVNEGEKIKVAIPIMKYIRDHKI